MKRWMNDMVPEQGSNGYPRMADPAAGATMIDPSVLVANQTSFHPSHFSNGPQAEQQHGQHPLPVSHALQIGNQQHPHHAHAPGLSNGSVHNMSPSSFASGHPAYPNPVIPAKRPRPFEDGASGSPRPHPNLIPGSRADTPPQPGSIGQYGPSPLQGPPPHNQSSAPFSHLQGGVGSANATPSPTMAHQMRSGNITQRVATASPHSYSPGPSHLGGTQHGSPAPSEQGTPQPNQFVSGAAPGFASNFQSPGNMTANGAFSTGAQMSSIQFQRNMPFDHQQQQQQQQRLLQMRAQQQRQMQAQVAAHGLAPYSGMPQTIPGSAAGAPIPNSTLPNANHPQGPPPPPQRHDSATFLKNLHAFLSSRGLPVELNPMLYDRPVNLLALFQQVQARGGFRMAAAGNSWMQIAAALGFHPSHFPAAPSALRAQYEQTLLMFEETIMTQRQQKQQKGMMMMMPGQPMPPRAQLPMPGVGGGAMAHPSIMPGPLHTPSRPGQLPQEQPQSGVMAEFPGPHQQQHTGAMVHSPAPAAPGVPQRRQNTQSSMPGTAAHIPPSPVMPDRLPKLSHHSNFRTERYMPAKVINRDSYGDVGEFDRTFRDAGLVGAMRPDVPPIRYLGNINIHALSRSIQSGINGEIRVALDTLMVVTKNEIPSLYLYISACDELLEVLVECAEAQIDILARSSVEISDEVELVPYEDVARACQMDALKLRKDAAFGSLDHKLDMAAERLLCIVAIMRNFTFPPEGVSMEAHMGQMLAADQTMPGIHPLGVETVVELLSQLIRCVGTRVNFLRTNFNTLEFMKDVITLLSNIAGYMEVLKRDQAQCLLQFVLAFAPKPQSQPMTWDHAPARHPYQQHDGDNDVIAVDNDDAADGVNVETEDRKEDDMDDVDDDLEGRQLAPADKSDNIVFATYEPAVHPYLPLAVDCLAKLLALGDPHRMHFESVLRGQADSPTRFRMLSRAFGLAMAAIPNLGKDSDRVPAPVQIDMRTTSIMQALLAGDILTSLAPGHEYGLVRSWLASPSGIAQNLNRLIQELMLMFEMRPRQVALSRNSTVREEPDLPATLLMIKRALAMLANLLAKARDPKNPGAEPLPPGAVISEACALHALNMKPDMWAKEGALSMLLQCVDLDR